MYIKYVKNILRFFILLELQLNTILLQSKLILTKSFINNLLFYNCIKVNLKLIVNAYYICSIYDIIIIPYYIFLIQNLQNKRYNYLINFQFQPLLHYILSPKSGLLIVITEPHFFFNSILLKTKIKYQLIITSIFSKKFTHIIGFNGLLTLRFLRYLQLFK